MSAIFRQVCCKMALYKAKLMTSAASLWGSFSFMWNIFAGTKIQEDPQGRMTSLCLFTVYLNTRCVCSPAFSNPLVFVERKISKELLPTLWEKFTGRRLVRTSTTSRQRHYRGGGWLLTKTFPSWCYIDWVLDGMYRYVYLYIQVHTCMYKDIYIYIHNIHANYYPYTQAKQPWCRYSSSKKKTWSALVHRATFLVLRRC